MKFIIKHEIRGRLRIGLLREKLSDEEADRLQYYLESRAGVTSAKVQERLAEAVIRYEGGREDIIAYLQDFRFEKIVLPDSWHQNSGRQTNRYYWDKLVMKVVMRGVNRIFLPFPVRAAIAGVRSVPYIWTGVKTLAGGKLTVPVLDALAIGVSMARGDVKTAASVMFLLGVGEILEEWTHKKSVGDLARSMSLNVSRVWLEGEQGTVLVPVSEIEPGDRVRVHMGNVIPFDGIVLEGEAMVNQASLTGEALPVRKHSESAVYAGTVVEEGEILIEVREVGGSSKYEKIVTMIEETQKLKSSLEGKAENLADKLVPFTLAGTIITYLLTRNVTKALAILMVDYSCALKLAMPVSVLSAIREAGARHITVKGGKYLEAVAEADTLVFDKTGTLTKAKPVVADVVSFCEKDADELLRLAACLEEHFPHSMARAVVEAAKEKNLVHEELHSQVEYIVAHGISSTVDEKRVVIGSHHFVFEDEGCTIDEGARERFEKLSPQYSHLYLAVDGRLSAVICISDPLREEAPEVIAELKSLGFQKIVMMTGDSERAARAAAEKTGVDAYFAEVLPEDKERYIKEEKAAGRKVVMVGDGINDSPALSAADAGIAVSDGAEIAREIADVIIEADDLQGLADLKRLSNLLMKRTRSNYRNIVGFNTGLLVLGAAGLLQPAASALLHNTSTLLISLNSMKNLL